VVPQPPPTWYTLGGRLRSVALRYRFCLVQQSAAPARWGVRRALFATPATNREGLPAGPTVRSAELARLEAVLFLAREPLSTRKLAQLADLADGTQARTLARALDRLYDEENRSFRVIEVAGGFQLLSRPQFAPWLRRLCSAPVEVRLSGPALETLAVVAYRQPVLRVAIEAVRGVQCGEILRQLMERDLVKIVGRSDELGGHFCTAPRDVFFKSSVFRAWSSCPAEICCSLMKPHCGPPRNRRSRKKASRPVRPINSLSRE